MCLRLWYDGVHGLLAETGPDQTGDGKIRGGQSLVLGSRMEVRGSVSREMSC